MREEAGAPTATARVLFSGCQYQTLLFSLTT